MLRNVYLEGELGEVFTPHFQVECKTTAEVFKCLDANYPEFKPYFQQKHEEGGYVHIEACGEELEHSEELLMEIGKGDIIISNIPAGSKAAAKIIVGAILIVAGAMLIAWNPVIGSMIMGMGISMAVGGLMELMAPDPAVDKIENGDESYLFNGNAQSIASGDPVPVLYGRLRVPGQPMGFEIIGDNVGYNPYQIHTGDGGMSPSGFGFSTESPNFKFSPVEQGSNAP
jgi:predicted phage tail protein